MLSSKGLHLNIFKKCIQDNLFVVQRAQVYNRSRIGNREWVGWGINGEANYMDHPAFPMPAVRWKENTNELLALREKEKGDWRKLTLEEKKCLYRASFCQTLEEAEAPTGQWKEIVGWTLIYTSVGIFLFLLLKFSLDGDVRTGSRSEENRAKQLRAILDLKIGGARGTSSKWDYEKDDWKK